jgi:hypothetical protein
MDFSGTYYVVSSPHFDDEYLRLSGTPYVTLRQHEDRRIEGEYRIAVQSGTLIGHAYSNFIDFSFGGSDEMEEAFGKGEASRTGIARPSSSGTTTATSTLRV